MCFHSFFISPQYGVTLQFPSSYGHFEEWCSNRSRCCLCRMRTFHSGSLGLPCWLLRGSTPPAASLLLPPRPPPVGMLKLPPMGLLLLLPPMPCCCPPPPFPADDRLVEAWDREELCPTGPSLPPVSLLACCVFLAISMASCCSRVLRVVVSE